MSKENILNSPEFPNSPNSPIFQTFYKKYKNPIYMKNFEKKGNWGIEEFWGIEGNFQ